MSNLPENYKVDHALLDEKGRKIGGHVHFREESAIVCQGCGRRNVYGCCGRDDHRIEKTGAILVHVQATRNGKDYGATGGGNARRAYDRQGALIVAENLLRDQRARYAKKYRRA